MRDGRWRQLIRDLESRGYDSEYLNRLRRRVDPELAWTELEQELVRETAQALGRAEDKLNLALLRLEMVARQLEQAASSAERLHLVRRFNELREAALRVRYDLIVHREAVGMCRNQDLERLYPIPPPLRLDE